MSVSRVRINDGTEFNPTEWLRREVLWASIKAPYDTQMDGWINSSSTEIYHHNSNASRRDVYESFDDIDSLSVGFFNHGKHIAGLISSSLVFRSYMETIKPAIPLSPLEKQKRSIEKTLGTEAIRFSWSGTRTEGYQECVRLAIQATNSPTPFIKNHSLLRASHIALSMASIEAKDWLNKSIQDAYGNLPNLSIENGGHPRSTGEEIEKLRPHFIGVLKSDEYINLSSS